MSNCEFSINNDFNNATQVNLAYLKLTINNDPSISVNLDHTYRDGDCIKFFFDDELSESEDLLLLNHINTYVYIANTIRPVSEIFPAIVSNDPDTGDFTSIVAAFNSGKTSVYVRNGVYFEPSNIIVPKGGQLIGESYGAVYIYGKGVTVDATSGVYEDSGTISINSNSKAVVGTGTTFTNLSIGEYIMIGNNYLEIDSITDDTHLNIKTTFKGKNITNDTYIAQNMYTGIGLANFIVVGSMTEGLFIRGVRHSTFKSIACDSCIGSNIKISEIGDCMLDTFVAGNGYSHGIEVSNCIDVLLDVCNIHNNSGSGIIVNGISNFIAICRCTSTSNSLNGIHITDTSSEVNVLNTYTKLNSANGIKADVNTDRLLFSNCICNDNALSGIEIKSINATITSSIIRENDLYGVCVIDESQVSNNQISHNDRGVCCEGHDISILGNNITHNTSDGIYIDGDNNSITNNISRDNVTGINITNTSSYNNIIANQVRNNTTDINNLGSNNSLVNNIT